MFRSSLLLILTLAVLLVFGGCAKKVTEEPVVEPAPQVVEPAPVPAPEPEPVVVTPEPVKEAVVEVKADIKDLTTVYFDFDSDVLTSVAEMSLKMNAQWFLKFTDFNVTIEGHCDERGSDEYNLALGERRASAVKDFLVSLGVANERLSVVSYGEEKPAMTGNDKTSWSKNRRVEFTD